MYGISHTEGGEVFTDFGTEISKREEGHLACCSWDHQRSPQNCELPTGGLWGRMEESDQEGHA